MSFNNIDFYKDYQEHLATLIYENSNGEISKEICANLAKNAVSRMKHDILQGIHKDIKEYADACVWAYFQ